MNHDERVPLNISSDQLALEREMATRGIERYRSNQSQALEMGRVSVTAPGRRLIIDAVDDVVAEIAKWLEGEVGKPGPRNQAIPVLTAVDPYAAAALAMQALMDGAASGMKRSTIVCNIATLLRDEAMLGHMRDTHGPLYERLNEFKIPKHMRTSVANRWLREGLWKYEKPLRNDQVQAALVLFVIVLDQTNLFRVETTKTKSRVEVVVRIAPEALEWMEKTHEAHEALSPVYLPMVQEPLDWGPNQVGGYRSNMARRKPLCRVQRAAHVDELRHADMPEIYRAINACQATPWRVHPEVYEVARTLWDSNAKVADMPDRQQPEFPEKPTDEEGLKQWKGMKTEALTRYRAEGSSRLRHARTLDLAGRFVGDTIYYPHFLDFRARMYPVPAWLNHQGPDLSRGLLQFERSSRVEHGSPEAALFLDYGSDLWKGDIPSGLVQAVYDDPLDCLAWERADKPWQFLAWCLDAAPWMADEGHPVRTPVLADGSNNGLQIYSLLMRDESLARMTNVYPGEKVDAYQLVADKVWARIKADPSEDARKWRMLLPDGLPREAVKRPVMASPYGIRKHSAMGYLRAWLLKTQEKVGMRPWDHSTFQPCIMLADLIWEEVQSIIAPATVCMSWLRDVADAVGGPVVWTNPAGFPIRQDYPKVNKRQVRATVSDTVRYVRYFGRMDETSSREQRDGLPPNFVHSLDSAALTLTINRCLDHGIRDFHMVHDSYGTRAEDAPLMARLLRETFAEMFSEDLLTQFVEEVRMYAPDATIPDPPALGTLDPTVVLDSTHFFC